MDPCLSGCEKGRSGHLDVFTMRSMPSKSKLNNDVVNVTACVVLASQRRPAHARGFAAAREPHTTIAYAMSGTAYTVCGRPSRVTRRLALDSGTATLEGPAQRDAFSFRQ
jgi:hypothetical protein